MKNTSVTISTGGGGSPEPVLQTECVLTDKVNFNCHAELRERAEAQSENHAFRGAVSRESSKTVSASVPCRKLPVTLDRSRNKFGMTLQKITMSCGFTMAEILLSLTIIGVVAAITLPSLTGNINERTWNTQRKALYARFSQAIALMPALNGYGTLTEGDSSTSAEDTAAETFVTAGLSKVLKINNICDSEHLEDCGIVSQITNLQASKVDVPTTLVGLNPMFNSTFIGGPTGSEAYQYSQLDTKAAAFETANGESIIVYYNPNCISDLAETTWNYRQAKMCANFIYDLNGNKGPNTFGKDIGVITVLYPSDSSVVAPVPVSVGSAGSTSQKNAGKLCQAQDSESRVPNRDELAAIFYNRVMFGLPGSGYFWTSSVIDSSNGWGQSFYTGRAATLPRTGGYNVWCVKR